MKKINWKEYPKKMLKWKILDKQRIINLHQLRMAVDYKKAITCPKSLNYGKPMPAAFIINMSGAIIFRLFESGMYVYEKKTK